MDERTKQAIGTVATAGRIALLPVGLFSLVAAFVSDYKLYDQTQIAGALGSVALIGLGVAGLIRPLRALDAAALFVCGTLAGSYFPVGFEAIHSGLAIVAWLFLVAAAGATGVGLATGGVEADPRLGEALRSATSSVGGGGQAPQQAYQQQQPAYQPPQQAHQQPRQPAAQSGPAAGWYDQGNGTLRWWDGRAWTDDIRPVG